MNILNPPKTAIRIKGTKSAKVKIKGNIKGAISIGLTISAIGAKLKPIVIGKGTTNRCLTKFSLKSDTIGAFSKSGWINESIMILVIDQIHKKVGDTKSVLLLDQYKAHRTERIREYANSKNITLVYVPIGMTGKYQPLDVTINGMLKAKMRKSYSMFIENNKNETYTHAKCISDLIINLKSISKKAVINSFNCLE